MILAVHDHRNWLQPKKGGWIDGTHHAGIVLYNDPVEIIFRKNDSEIRKDLVITLEDGKWVAHFFKDGRLDQTVKI